MKKRRMVDLKSSVWCEGRGMSLLLVFCFTLTVSLSLSSLSFFLLFLSQTDDHGTTTGGLSSSPTGLNRRQRRSPVLFILPRRDAKDDDGRWTDAAAFNSVAEGHEAAETELGADI